MIILDSQDQVHEIDIAGSKVVFTVRPENIKDLTEAFLAARIQLTRLGLAAATEAEQQEALTVMAGRAVILQRIIAWQGVAGPDGADLPCSREALEHLFGRYPDAFMTLMRDIRARDGALLKN